MKATRTIEFPAKKKGNYANGCISEHISCMVLDSIGLNVQKTLMGIYETDGKMKTVVACRDFTEGGLRFADFGTLKNMCIETSENGYGTELKDIEAAFDEQEWIEPEELRRFYWDMFVGDALIGNFDRHNGNWRFPIDENHGCAYIAPIFDCGSSLYPQLPIDEYRRVLNSRAEIDSGPYAFTKSAIQIDGYKIGYNDYLTSHVNPHCDDALRRRFHALI